MVVLDDVTRLLDGQLRSAEVPDYEAALNGLQFGHVGPVRRVAAAVDFSLEAVRATAAGDANLLLVHHGMFWSGPRRLVGPAFERIRLLIEHDIAVYSSHIPLDLHPQFGNNVLLARELGLMPDSSFGVFRGVAIGCAGTADLSAAELQARLSTFAQPLGSTVISTARELKRRTRRWAIVTGAGASAATLREAAASGIDTLIVGEGPHHSAIEAIEHDIVVMYAGHYATETLGVRALAAELERAFGLPWFAVHAPTGL